MIAPLVVTVRGRWFPADTVLPDRTRPWNRVYVLATDTDLAVWQRQAETPDWASPIVWADTPALPRTDREAHRGFDITTAAGLVVITLGTGCRCGTLGRWRGPSWAVTERATG